MNYFGELTPRMQQYREKLLHVKPMVCVERAKITTKSYQENLDQPLTIRRAKCLASILEKMSIYIEPETLIAGNQASSNRAAPIFPEYAMDWVIEELDQFEKRDGDRFYITEQNKKDLRDMAPFWEHNTTKDRGLAAMPKKSRLLYDLGIIKAEGNITSGDAHIAVNYKKVLEYGLKDYKERAQRKMEGPLFSRRQQKNRRFPRLRATRLRAPSACSKAGSFSFFPASARRFRNRRLE